MAEQKRYVALVTGATGISSLHLTRKLASDRRFGKIYAVSRRELYDVPESVRHVCLDLQDKEKIKQALADKDIRDVTHLFQNAFQFTGDHVTDVEVNFGMHKNIIDGLEAAGNTLQHVYFNAGGKWYGQAVGPVLKTPAREDDPRHLPPNFYYNMQDYCEQRVKSGASWTWSSLRPDPVAGYSRGSAMNITMSLVVYAAICKELGLALRFPGSVVTWNALMDICDVDILADATIYCATHKETANEAFNVSNGDVFRWRDLWPEVAKYFGMEVGYPQPLKLSVMMNTPDKEELWKHMIKKYGLQQIEYEHATTWDFADAVWHQAGDFFANVNKLRQAGFAEMKVDTDKMFIRQMKDMVARKVIPDPKVQRPEPNAVEG